jgi:glycosyltransferase involved in cell wall biosynthesis
MGEPISSMDSILKISIVIPAYGRSPLLQRAVRSVLACDGIERVQIIIVDDCSPEPITCEELRSQDKIIRQKLNSGAAVCRNVGIDNAQGELISFLDSDDYYVNRNFEYEYELIIQQPALYYTAIESQGFKSDYPAHMEKTEFFERIFFKSPHIGQTSSLIFNKNLNIRFDESLPKHQDWDFILSTLCQGIPVKQLKGNVFFDRSDQQSLSRKYSPEKSIPWFQKLNNTDLTSEKIEYIRFNLFCLSITHYSWRSFIVNAIIYFFSRNLSFTKIVKFCVRKLLK